MQLLDIQRSEAEDVGVYFPDRFKNDGDQLIHMALGLVGEVGETANEIKKWDRGDFDWVELSGRLRKELPDILIYLVLVADVLGINLETAYHNKKEFNDQRFREAQPGVRSPDTSPT